MDILQQKTFYELVIKTNQDALASLIKLCSHPRAVKIPKANTGNWCTSDDRYWYECKCPDCGKYWTEDQ